MKAVLALAKCFALSSVREWDALFWFWLFPALLLALLGAAFGGVERGEMELLVILAAAEKSSLAQALLQSFREMAKGAGPSLRVEILTGVDLTRVRKEVEGGEAQAALFIPFDFSAELLAGGKASVQILYRRGEAGSSAAASFLQEFVEEFGLALLQGEGFLSRKIPVEMREVGGEARPLRYVDFLLPGVLLMALFVYGLFSVPSAIVRAKEVGLLKRYFASPLSKGGYLLGFSLSALLVNAFQVFLVVVLGRLAFGVRLPFLRPESLGFLFLGFAISLGLGFLVSAFSRTYQGAMALASLLNLPLQFLGGLYFPLTAMPKVLRPFMAANPLTHLAEGLRASLGLSTPVYPLWLSLLVLFLWLCGTFAFSACALGRKDEGFFRPLFCSV
ncbi:MAG: ABC transporter permease [Candidatus Bipolaricaulaceae bacterium]